jgi:hypothetical protein
MLGLFITGPGGALLGAVLGGSVTMLGLPQRSSTGLLIGVACFLAAVTLYFCIPQVRH